MVHPELIALDLDGTLLDDQHAVGPRARAAIQALRDRDVEVLLVTGRPPRMTREFLDLLGLAQAIVFNGASRFDHAREVCEHHHQLAREDALAVLERLRAHHGDIGLGMETHHGWYLEPSMDERRRRHPRPLSSEPPDGVGVLETFVRDAVIKVFARHADRASWELAEALAGLDVYATWSGAGLLEVMHPAVNKRDALERYTRARGIPRGRVAAFGDQHNDREMLAWAGHGVAMGNADKAVKAVADEVAGDHDDDGVAVVLERWL